MTFVCMLNLTKCGALNQIALSWPKYKEFLNLKMYFKWSPQMFADAHINLTHAPDLLQPMLFVRTKFTVYNYQKYSKNFWKNHDNPHETPFPQQI